MKIRKFLCAFMGAVMMLVCITPLSAGAYNFTPYVSDGEGNTKPINIYSEAVYMVNTDTGDVLVDINGAGVLITGDSGIGKSEAAIELIQRGHRLVSDDAVEIRKVSDETLIGMAPEMTKHFMELRGIGILDIKNLYGVNSVLDTQRIDMVVKLEEWDPDKNYRRLGEEDDYIEYLGNRVTCYTIPLRPGRNLAVILEAAALNHRQRRMGYNAAAELQKRVRAHRR